MPRAEVYNVEANSSFPSAVNIAVTYRDKLFMIHCYGNGVSVVDVLNKSVKKKEQTTDALTVWSRYVTHYYKPPLVRVRSVIIKRCEILLVEDTVRLSENIDNVTIGDRKIINKISADWVDRWECIAHSSVIPPLLLMMPDWNRGMVHYVNISTGNILTHNLGSESYENQYRFSHKYVVTEEDIKMLAGKHLAGSECEVWYVYKKKRVNLVSTGGGSPRPCMYGLVLLSDKVLIPATSGGVIYTNNDVAVFDSNFRLLGKIHSRDIFDFDNAWPFGHIFATSRDGGYYVLAGGNNNCASYASRVQLFIVKVDNKFNVLKKWKLLDTNVSFETYANAYPGYSDMTAAPIIDIYSKKMYLYVHDPKISDHILHIDISDIFDDINEFNKVNWFITGHGVVPPRIPTMLMLHVYVNGVRVA